MFCSSDFYVLELKDFQSNVIKNLQDIRNDESFFDVTIACDDKNVVKGHKVVLSASSNYLRSILRRSSVNQHTVIFLPEGVNHNILVEMMDFIYNGEIKLSVEDLEPFISLANYLKIRGLAKGSGDVPTRSAGSERLSGLAGSERLTGSKDGLNVGSGSGTGSAQPANPRKRRDEVVKPKPRKVLLNSWTSNSDVPIADEADKQDGLDAHRGADNQPIEKTGVVPEECLRNGLRQIKFQCDQCTQIFGEKLEFVRHVITAHKRRDKIVEKAEASSRTESSDDPIEKIPLVDGPPFACNVCGQLFKHLRCRQSHQSRIHSQGEPKKVPSRREKYTEPIFPDPADDDDDGIELKKVIVRGTNIGPCPKA